MKKNSKTLFLTIIVIIIISITKSSSVTIEIAKVSNFEKHSFIAIGTFGEKTKISVPSNFDTSILNENSRYLIHYRSNIFKKNTLKNIEKIKEETGR